MRKVTIEIFKFNELSADAQKVAIENLRDINIQYEWYNNIIEEDAKPIGLKIDRFDVNRKEIINGRFIGTTLDCAHSIIANHGTECATFARAKKFIEEWNTLLNKWGGKIDGITPDGKDYYLTFENDATEYDFENNLKDFEDDFLRSLLHDYSILLHNEYNHLQSNEEVKETIIDNDFDFLITGKQY
jgi:hypothetical protein